LKYLCNLVRYWLQGPWGWHDSVETFRSVIICEIIVHLLVILQNSKICKIQGIKITNFHCFAELLLCRKILQNDGCRLVFRFSQRYSRDIRLFGKRFNVTGQLFPPVLGRRSGLLFKSANVQEEFQIIWSGHEYTRMI
jgi:hypothetical protein